MSKKRFFAVGTGGFALLLGAFAASAEAQLVTTTNTGGLYHFDSTLMQGDGDIVTPDDVGSGNTIDNPLVILNAGSEIIAGGRYDASMDADGNSYLQSEGNYDDFYTSGATSSVRVTSRVTLSSTFGDGSGAHEAIAQVAQSDTGARMFQFDLLDAPGGGRLRSLYFIPGVGVADLQYLGSDLQAGQSYEVEMGYNPAITNQEAFLRFDDNVTFFDLPSAGDLAPGDHPLTVGALASGGQRFGGSIDEFRVSQAPEVPDLITANFDDFGTTSSFIVGRASEDPGEDAGWIGPWSNQLANNTHHYYAGERLTYNAPGYNNAPNEGDAEDGTVGIRPEGGVQLSGAATRPLRAPLDGTVWISALAHIPLDDENNIGETLLWLDFGEDEADYIAIRGGQASLRFDAVNSSGDEALTTNATHLLLAKLQIGAGDDSIEFWVDPDLSGGEAGLGMADLTGSGLDAYGDALNNIGVSFARVGSRMDAIRISNAANGFELVTGVPEPTSLTLLGLFGVAIVALQRRAR